VSLRWCLIGMLAPLLMFLIAVTMRHGFAPLRARAPKLVAALDDSIFWLFRVPSFYVETRSWRPRRNRTRW
jgi:hypothetical protein